jgi:hypothetical protein
MKPLRKTASVSYIAVTLVLFSTFALAEPVVLLETAPQWKTGDTWKFEIDKELDRTVTQGAGMLQITMKLDKVTGTMTYTVTGTAEVAGEECYSVNMAGEQRITGSYNTMQAEGESSGGAIVQSAAIVGTEYRRVRDLAFVKADLRSEGTIQLGGDLGGVPTPFVSNSITTANPPVQILRYPIIEGESWTVSSTLNTSATGTSPDSIITTFNYRCTVIGTEEVKLDNGETYQCIVISQEGTQTTQSQNSGINIDTIDGPLFFSPQVANRIKDDAEGERLIEYVPGGNTQAE